MLCCQLIIITGIILNENSNDLYRQLLIRRTFHACVYHVSINRDLRGRTRWVQRGTTQEEAEMGKVCIETCNIDDLFMRHFCVLPFLRFLSNQCSRSRKKLKPLCQFDYNFISSVDFLHFFLTDASGNDLTWLDVMKQKKNIKNHFQWHNFTRQLSLLMWNEVNYSIFLILLEGITCYRQLRFAFHFVISKA